MSHLSLFTMLWVQMLNKSFLQMGISHSGEQRGCQDSSPFAKNLLYLALQVINSLNRKKFSKADDIHSFLLNRPIETFNVENLSFCYTSIALMPSVLSSENTNILIRFSIDDTF